MPTQQQCPLPHHLLSPSIPLATPQVTRPVSLLLENESKWSPTPGSRAKHPLQLPMHAGGTLGGVRGQLSCRDASAPSQPCQTASLPRLLLCFLLPHPCFEFTLGTSPKDSPTAPKDPGAADQWDTSWESFHRRQPCPAPPQEEPMEQMLTEILLCPLPLCHTRGPENPPRKRRSLNHKGGGGQPREHNRKKPARKGAVK